MKIDHIPCAGCPQLIPPGVVCIISASGKAYCSESCVKRIGKQR